MRAQARYAAHSTTKHIAVRLHYPFPRLRIDVQSLQNWRNFLVDRASFAFHDPTTDDLSNPPARDTSSNRTESSFPKAAVTTQSSTAALARRRRDLQSYFASTLEYGHRSR
jgi:hypothetical protein